MYYVCMCMEGNQTGILYSNNMQSIYPSQNSFPNEKDKLSLLFDFV